MFYHLKRFFFRGSVALAALIFFAFNLRPALAGAPDDLAAFSEIRDVDLARLADGKAITAQGASMGGFARGIAVQACYLVPLPLQKTVELHKQFNGARHPELKVYLHRELPSKPTPADFQAISGAPGNSAVRALVEATQKLGSGRSELQMSAGEAKSFSAAGGSEKKGLPPAVVSFWSNLLYRRTLDFISGGAGRQPQYETTGETISASEEISRLLKAQPKVRDQFKGLLDSAGRTGGGGRPSLSIELFDVEHRAAFTLGASYSKAVKDGWQALDLQYYSSGGYFAMLTFYQFWPVETASGPATLVWRGDLLSSATLADLHGVEKTGSVTAMRKESQKSIGTLQSDARTR